MDVVLTAGITREKNDPPLKTEFQMRNSAIFCTDLHGRIDRYKKLFSAIINEKPRFVFLGGDLLPHGLKNSGGYDDFAGEYLIPSFFELKKNMGPAYPKIFLILGNDDHRSEEIKFVNTSRIGLFHYLNKSWAEDGGIRVFGYPFVPPTPFRLKDWEKYDESVHLPPGCIPPDSGFRSTPPDYDPGQDTIGSDLSNLTFDQAMDKAVLLLHSPPYGTFLDRAALDDRMIQGMQVDVHIGSRAILDLLEKKQPMLALHGHVHESTRITGQWKGKIRNTVIVNGAHDGPELCLVMIHNIFQPEASTRVLQ